jgi:hypothetical protein
LIRPPLSSVDDVRAELRRLGYLESGLDRFVLGGAASTPTAASAKTACRVGLVGGVVVGAGLTLAAIGLDRRLLAQPRDLVVLFLYLAVAAGLAVAALAFVGGLVAGALARRTGHRPGPGFARNVGLVLGALGAAYLALWWRSHMVGASPFARALVLAVGFALVLLLARFGSLAAVAVTSAAGLSGALEGAGLTRRRLLPLVAAAVFLLGGGVLAASSIASQPAPPPDYAVVPTGLRVRLLGLDGFDPRMADRLAARGDMPRFAALIAQSARGRLHIEPEQVPAIVWTTIATGRGPEAHGITAPGARRMAGMRTPFSVESPGAVGRAFATAADLLRITRPQTPTDTLRSVKTFWNVAADKGLKVGVSNWWATWPAETSNGYVVTDRAMVRLERGGSPDREFVPQTVGVALKAILDKAPIARPRRLDTFALDAALALRSPDLDVEAVYLPGLDIATSQSLDEAHAADLASLETRLDAVRDHYRFVDGLLGRYADSLSADDVLIVVGDPGRLARRGGEGVDGVVLLRGSPIRPGDLGLVSERDIAPTALSLVGLPRSRELDGRVIESALGDAFRASHPIREVPTYGRRTLARPAESALDPAVLEELKSLGYIQ